MVDEVSSVPGMTPIRAVQSSPLKDASQLAAQLQLNQEASEEAFQDYVEQLANPFQRYNVQSNLNERIRRTKEKDKAETEQLEVPEAIEGVGSMEEAAARFHKRNAELNDRVLTLLWQRVQSAQTEDEVLDIVQEFYPDPSLADEALEFLIAAEPEMARRAMIERARDKLHKRFEKEIRAGKNIATVARAFAAKGLRTPTSLRALYRYILDNPREPTELFEDLAAQFSYDQLKEVIKFLVHSLNADLKALAPSLEPAELRHYMAQCRVLSAILGVYFFFLKNYRSLLRQFALYGIPYPSADNFESLARIFCRLVDDRYPNQMKILQLAPTLGVQGNFAGQLLFFYLFGRAINEVAPRLFRTEQAKEALRKAIVEATEQIENQIDENEKEKLQSILVAQVKQRRASSGRPTAPKTKKERSRGQQPAEDATEEEAQGE
jgi:type III secretion protein W